MDEPVQDQMANLQEASARANSPTLLRSIDGEIARLEEDEEWMSCKKERDDIEKAF